MVFSVLFVFETEQFGALFPSPHNLLGVPKSELRLGLQSGLAADLAYISKEDSRELKQRGTGPTPGRRRRALD